MLPIFVSHPTPPPHPLTILLVPPLYIFNIKVPSPSAWKQLFINEVNKLNLCRVKEVYHSIVMNWLNSL